MPPPPLLMGEHARARIDLNYSSGSINLPVTSIAHISGVV